MTSRMIPTRRITEGPASRGCRGVVPPAPVQYRAEHETFLEHSYHHRTADGGNAVRTARAPSRARVITS